MPSLPPFDDDEFTPEEQILPKKRPRAAPRTDGQTESDSDFDVIDLEDKAANTQEKDKSIRRKKTIMSQFRDDASLPGCLTLGEVAGRLPSSLLVNVDFNKFASLSGLESLDQNPSCLKTQGKPPPSFT